MPTDNPTKTCGTCQYGRFQLTPSGRVKQGVAAPCMKVDELVKRTMEALKEIPPCVTVSQTHTVRVWPRYDATHCPSYERK